MFEYSEKSKDLQLRLAQFMDRHIYPNESAYAEQRQAASERFAPLPLVEELKVLAQAEGLWNLFVPPEYANFSPVGGLSNLDYAPLAEIMGRVLWSAEVFNCSAPDTRNMELLHMFATPKRKERWLSPLFEGEIRSCFMMTEPDVASSDATNIQLSIRKDGDEYVLNGRKWFITGALDPRSKVAIVIGITDPEAVSHKRHSQVIVPLDSPGLIIDRNIGCSKD